MVRLLVALAVGLGSFAGCQASAPTPPPTVPDVTITIPVPVRDKAMATAAIAVFEARIRQLGYGTFSSAIGDVMTFSLPGDPPPDVAKIRAALGAHGSLSFLPVPSSDGAPQAGAPAPVGIEPLFEPAGAVQAASVVDQQGSPALQISLAPEAAASLADYSGANVGDYLVIVLDGIVLTSPMIASEIPDGEVVVSFATGAELPYDLDVLAAVLSSGPLPAEWP